MKIKKNPFLILVYLVSYCSSLQNYFISNLEECPQNTICDGSFTNPFTGIISAFSQAILISHKTEDFSIIFHLLSQDYVITNQQLQILSENHYVVKYNSTYQLFEKNDNSSFELIRIKPNLCSNDSNKECSTKGKISIKTQNFSIALPQTMYIENIDFLGNNVPFSEIKNSNNCLNSSVSNCCNIEDLLNSSSENCSLLNFDNRNRSDLTKYDYYHGLFQYKYSNTTLNIIACSFNYMISITKDSTIGFLFLIGTYIDLKKKYDHQIVSEVYLEKIDLNVMNSSFESNYFLNGIVYFSEDCNKINMSFSNSIISNYNVFNIRDIRKDFNNFTFVSSNSTLNFELVSFINNSNLVFASLNNLIYMKDCSINLVFSVNHYEWFSIVTANMYNTIEVNNLSTNIQFTDQKYISDLNFPPLEENTRPYYLSSSYAFFHLKNQNSILIENSTFNDIENLAFVDSQNFTTISLKNIDILNIYTIDKYFIQFVYKNTLLLSNVHIFNVSSTNNPFISFFNYNNITLVNVNANSFLNTCLIYAYQNNNLSIYKSSFQNFEAKDYAPLFRFSDYNIVVVKNTQIDSITSEGSSACFYMYTYNYFTIENSTIVNIAANEGAAIYLSDYNTFYMTKVTTILATAYSDTIYFGRNYNNNLSVDNCSFFEIAGCIVKCTFNGYIYMNNVYAKGIYKSKYSTQVLTIFENTTGFLNNSLIEYYYSENTEGLIYGYSLNSYIYMNNNTFRNNVMKRGPILVFDTEIFGEIINCTFINTSSLDFGGVIYMQSHNFLKIIQSIFINNLSPNNGGSIYAYSSNKIELYGCKFINSTSMLYGGVIEIEENNVLIINNSNFSIINALKGGLIYAKTLNIITINDSKLSNCFTNQGAFIYFVNFNTITLQRIKVTNMTADKNGGILFSFLNNTIKIENSNFSSIHSLNLAGGFYLDTFNVLKINQCLFENVSSDSSGGILYTVLKNVITFENSTIINSSLSYGDGAILFDLGILNLLFLNNSIWVGLSCYYSSYAIILEKSNEITIFSNVFKANVGGVLEGLVRANQNNKIKFNFCEILIMKEPVQLGIFFQLLKNSSLDVLFSNFSVNYYLVVNEILGGSTGNFISSNFNNLSSNHYFIKVNDQSFVNLMNIKLILQNDESIESINSNLNISKCIFYFNTKGARTNNFFIFSHLSTIILNFSKMVNNFKEMQLIYSKNSKVYFRKSDFIGFYTSFSGAILYGEQMRMIHIFNCQFLFNKAITGGGALFISLTPILGDVQTILKFFNNIFLKNTAFSKGGAFTIQSVELPTNFLMSNNYSYSIKLSKSFYLFNKAVKGGAIYLSSFFLIELEMNTFSYNTAVKSPLNNSLRAKGGALYISNSEYLEASFKNNLSLFRKNKAEIGGALYFDNSEILIYEENSKYSELFQSNLAKYYGNDKASSTSFMGFIEKYDKKTESSHLFQNLSIETVSIQSGNQCLFYILGVDKFQNIMFQTDEIIPYKWVPQQIFDLYNASYLSNDENHNITDGLICIQSFKRNELPIQAKFMYYLNLSKANIKKQSYLTISFRKCQIGEKLTKDLTCENCPYGKYSLVKDFQSTPNDCFQCQNLQFNCLGGFNMTPALGYWRYNNYSSNFMQCTQFKNCLGGVVELESLSQRKNEYSKIFTITNKIGDIAYSLVGFCAIGYAGILCNQCDEDYGKVNAYKCLKCYEGGYIAWVIFQILIKFVLIFVSLHISLETSISIFMNDVKERNIKLTYLIKIFFSHIQILIILFAFVDLIDPFNEVLGFSLGFSSNISEAFNLECLLKYYQWNVSTIYFQFWVSIIYWMPLSLVILLYSYILFQKTLKKYKNNLQITYFKYWNLFSAAFLILLDLCYFDMINISFRLFNCINVNDEYDAENRLLFDYSVQCDTEYHQSVRYVSFILVILCFGLGFPILLFSYLLYSFKKKQLNGNSCLLKMSYFFYVYQRKYFFWDVLHILKKFIALSIQILLSSHTRIVNNYSLHALLIMVLFFLFLQIKLRPYELGKYNVINRLEQYSLISLTITIYVLLLYNSLVTDEEILNKGLEIFFFVFAFLANLCFAILWFYIYIPEKKQELTVMLQDFQKKISFWKKKKKILKSLPKIEININSRQNFAEPETKVEIVSNNDIFKKEENEFLNIHNNNNEYMKSRNKNEGNEFNFIKDSNFEDFHCDDLMKITEKYYIKSIYKLNWQKFEKNKVYQLGFFNQTNNFLYHKLFNHKFVKYLFLDKIECLYECPEMKIGIQFFETNGSSLLQKARLTFKKTHDFVKFKSLKFNSSDCETNN